MQARLVALRRDETLATGTPEQRATLAGQLPEEADALQDLVYLTKRQANSCHFASGGPPSHRGFRRGRAASFVDA